MLFSLMIALMVILVAAFWTYQGFFSSAIMFFEVLIAGMLAFAFYEPLNGMWVESIGPGLGLPVALMAIFIVSLVVFRTLSDRYVTKDVELPAIFSRIGGGLCGFFTGMILTGMALIAIQMMPIGSDIFSFERMSYDREKGGPAKSSSLGIFSPDQFTYGLLGMLSDGGRFGTDDEHSLQRTQPDLITQLYSRRAVPQWEAREFLDQRDLEVKAYWDAYEIDHATHKLEDAKMVRDFETRQTKDANNKFLVATVLVKKSAAPEKRNDIRFRLAQFRVIGFDGGNQNETPKVYTAIGASDIYTNRHTGPKPVADAQRERLVAFSPLTNFILDSYNAKVIETSEGYQFDVAFEVPSDFKPWFIEFKAGARADMSAMKKSEPMPSWASRAQGKDGMSGATNLKEQAAPNQNVWNVTGGIVQKTGFTNRLPFEIPRNDQSLPSNIFTIDFIGTRDGVQFAYQIPEEKPTDFFATEFWVPEGKSMFIVTFDDPKKQSMWARSIQFANRVVGQTSISDTSGGQHFAIGQYAIAKIDGRWVYEIQYWPTAEIPERCLQDPKRVTQRILDAAGIENSYFGFIFLVPDSVTEIKEFQSGRGKPLELNISK